MMISLKYIVYRTLSYIVMIAWREMGQVASKGMQVENKLDNKSWTKTRTNINQLENIAFIKGHKKSKPKTVTGPNLETYKCANI